jgi:hypothetical protein
MLTGDLEVLTASITRPIIAPDDGGIKYLFVLSAVRT